MRERKKGDKEFIKFIKLIKFIKESVDKPWVRRNFLYELYELYELDELT